MFPFDAPENLAVIACKCIFHDNKPILRVIRDEDGDWQFLCGGIHSEADAMLVALRDVYNMDNSLSAVSQLTANQTATRSSVGEDWLIKD